MTAAYLAGIMLFTLGGFITLVNFYLSFLRYPIHRYRGGIRENYRWVSGFPVYGSLFLWISADFFRSNPILMWAAIALSLFDTAGLHWFVATMIFMGLRQLPASIRRLKPRR